MPDEQVGSSSESESGAGPATATPAAVLPDLESGRAWAKNPDPNVVVSEKGISKKQWVFDAVDDVRALAKWADVAGAEYSIGMERVGYTLGSAVGLPIPATYLEEYDGRPCSVQLQLRNHREFDMAKGSVMMWAAIDNEDVWPLGVAFDLWMANYDRRSPNLSIQPVPPEKKPAHATAGTTWFVDHGLCALWWPRKIDPTATALYDVAALAGTARQSVEDGEITPDAKARFTGAMPVEYRRSFADLDTARRAPLLDRVRSISDDLLEAAVMEVPDAYFSDLARELTIAFLRVRRDRIDTLSRDAFPP
jgi:hypothetical protein